MRRRKHPSARAENTSSNLLGFRLERYLTGRREIAIELPEFLIALLEQRVSEANDGAPSEERVTISHFIEYQVAEMLSIRDVAKLELEIPGFNAAVQDWLRAAQE